MALLSKPYTISIRVLSCGMAYKNTVYEGMLLATESDLLTTMKQDIKKAVINHGDTNEYKRTILNKEY